jgi:hypothetical protein
MSRHRVCLALIGLVAIAAAPASAATYVRGYAVDSLDLPASNAEANGFAFDLDGDGNPENQFGSVLAVLAGNLDLDLKAVNMQAVAGGTVVHLLELVSSDAAFAADPAAVATWYVGKPTLVPPLFDGSDPFEFDPAYPPAEFRAPLMSGNFASADPATTTEPVTLSLSLKVGEFFVELPLQGARLAFGVGADALGQGRVNGSIHQEVIQTLFVPALALTFDATVQADPTSERSRMLLDLFDNNPSDGSISVPEVANHSLMVSILSPDMDILDANGYNPDPDGPDPESLSFGFGFTAVQSDAARFPRLFQDGFEQ